jgi:hypothetical protein
VEHELVATRSRETTFEQVIRQKADVPGDFRLADLGRGRLLGRAERRCGNRPGKSKQGNKEQEGDREWRRMGRVPAERSERMLLERAGLSGASRPSLPPAGQVAPEGHPGLVRRGCKAALEGLRARRLRQTLLASTFAPAGRSGGADCRGVARRAASRGPLSGELRRPSFPLRLQFLHELEIARIGADWIEEGVA